MMDNVVKAFEEFENVKNKKITIKIDLRQKPFEQDNPIEK